MKLNHKEKLVYVFTTITIFMSCMVGGQIMGMSLAKIATLPLIVILLPQIITNIKSFRINSKQKWMILWFSCVVISSVIGLCVSDNNESNSVMLFNIIQILFIYIPLYFGLKKIDNRFEYFRRGIIITAIINSIWAVTQYVFWIIYGIDLNNLIFSDILKGFLGTNWTAYYNNGFFVTIRATGLTHDPAIFSLIMLFGFSLTNNICLRLLFLVSVMFAQARSGLVAILIFIFVKYFLDNPRRIKRRTVIRAMIILLVSSLILFLFSEKIQIVLDSIMNIIERFGNVFDKDARTVDGSNRHLLYAPISILVWLLDYNIIFKFFGKGLRAGGMALAESSYANLLGLGTKDIFPWSIECDFAENLLGLGAVGMMTVYKMHYLIYKKTSDTSVKALIVSLMIFGLMYNYSFLSVFILFIICSV